MKSTFPFAFKRGAAALAAASVAVCALLPAGNVLAAETTTDSSSDTFDDGTLTYKKLSNTTVSVTDCVESATHISIMPKIDGYDIVSIGEEAFANCTSLQSVTIPASVTEIGSAAFYGCTALTKVTVPDAVTKIEQGTFFSCTALTDLTLGKDTTEIGDMAFGYCTSLETVTLPDTVETLGDQLFYYCTALDDISIPDKVTELGSYTFYGCLALKSFEVPVNLEDIGAHVLCGVSVPGDHYGGRRQRQIYRSGQRIVRQRGEHPLSVSCRTERHQLYFAGKHTGGLCRCVLCSRQPPADQL
ncbi:MAG: leucine-rich repeat domain-containing protein [Ruminococcus callidus]